MTDFRTLVEEAAALADTPSVIASVADELDALIYEEHLTGYQHERLAAMVWVLRLAGERSP